VQQLISMTAASRRSQVVELLATGILRVFAGRALERDTGVAVERPSERPHSTATPSRPTAGAASR